MTREILIQPVLNGFVCRVGCQTIVFDSLVDMTSQIKRYYENPDQVEKEYVAHALNKTLQAVPEPCNLTSPCEASGRVYAQTATEQCDPSRR